MPSEHSPLIHPEPGRAQASRYVLDFDHIRREDRPSVGGKGVNLAVMHAHGIPVPPGSCITTEAHDYYRQTGQLPDGVADMVTELRDRYGGSVAIRSSATIEDGVELSLAGVFNSYYIGPDDNLEEAIHNIYKQAASAEVDEYRRIHSIDEEIKMGIVVQELVQPELSGVAYTKVNGSKMVAQYIDDFGARLVDGETHGSAALIEKTDCSIVQSMNYDLRPLTQICIRQLVDASAKLEELFGLPQDVEFVWRGDKLFIVQSRTQTTEINLDLNETLEDALETTKAFLHRLAKDEKTKLGTDRAIFSNSNFAELLQNPTEMDTGVFQYVFTGQNGTDGAIQRGRKEMGYPVPDYAAGYMQPVGGKPYFSIARDALTYYAGFPESEKAYTQSLIHEYLQAVTADPKMGEYPEIELYLQCPTYDQLAERFGDDAPRLYTIANEFNEKLRLQAENFLDSYLHTYFPARLAYLQQTQELDLSHCSPAELTAYCQGVLEHLRTESCVDFVKAARLGFYYSYRVIQELKTLQEIRSEEDLKQTFGTLTQGLGSAITEHNITIQEAPSDAEAHTLASNLLSHSSEKEILEIRHPRLKDDPEGLRTHIQMLRSQPSYRDALIRQQEARETKTDEVLSKIPLTKRDTFAQDLTNAQRYLSLRETIKDNFTKEYSLLRDGLEALADKLGLPAGDIYYVYPAELTRLGENPGSMHHLIEARKKRHELYKELEIPDVIRDDEIDDKVDIHQETEFTKAEGKYLYSGEPTQAIIVNVDEYNDLETVQEQIAQFRAMGMLVVVVARQLNLTQDPLIAAADGLIIQNAGIVSHGAQRVRELGKAAIGGIRTSGLKTGMTIFFDPQSQTVSRL